MTPVHLPYLWLPRMRGKLKAYYRRGGRTVRVTGTAGKPLLPDDAGFLAAYQRIHESFEAAPPARPGHGTLAHLVEHYTASPEYQGLADKTRRDYRRYLDMLRAKYGDLPVRTMPREFVLKIRNEHADKPRTANYIVQVLRLLLQHGVDHGTTFGVTVNVAARPKRLKTGDGHRPWEEHELTAFRDRWPPGTWERTAFELALNTGQRGGDIVTMAKSQIVDGWVYIRQAKTGARVSVPISDDLAAALDAWSAPDNVVMVLGKMGVDRFRHRMADAIKSAEVTQTTHGLRYTAASRLRELGMDWEDIAAITGHQTVQMARKYSQQKRAATVAIRRLDEATKRGR